MKKKNYVIIFVTLLILIALNKCDSISINVSESKENGNLIIEALDKYYIDKKEYPFSLDSLVPHYLSEIPGVVNKIYFPFEKREFKYGIQNHIPYHGAFTISYAYKKDGKTYRYDSRIGKTEWSGMGAIYPERFDIDIEHAAVEQIISAVKSYNNDSLKYPGSIKELVPYYLDSIPFDLEAQYRPRPDNPGANSNLFEYRSFQPSETFRGEYGIYFESSLGFYGYLNSEWYYDD